MGDNMEGVSPLWWDKIPDKVTPEYEALTQLLYDGTPLEIAENFKEQGNEAFKRGEKGYEDAIIFYSKAIEQNVPEADKASFYYSNRAAVNLALGNNRRCIDDCLKAIELNKSNIKGYWRAARAYNRISKFAECIDMCDKGLAQDPTNKEITNEKTQATEKLEAEKKRLEEAQKRAAEHAAANQQVYALIQRNDMVMGEPLFDVSGYPGKIYSDLNNQLHFSVLFIYEEYTQTDFIEDFVDTDTFADHIAEMFPEGQYLEWDVEKKYSQKSIEIYFESNWSTPVTKPRPHAPKEKKLIKVRQATTLKKVLQHESYIIPQFPVFYIVAADSPFKNKFLQSYK